jgi:hypothetical protein
MNSSNISVLYLILYCILVTLFVINTDVSYSVVGSIVYQHKQRDYIVLYVCIIYNIYLTTALWNNRPISSQRSPSVNFPCRGHGQGRPDPRATLNIYTNASENSIYVIKSIRIIWKHQKCIYVYFIFILYFNLLLIKVHAFSDQIN